MTNFEAYRAALSPYTLPKATIEFLMINQGLNGADTYTKDNEKTLYAAVIDGLFQLITLEKEKDPGTENDYNTENIMLLINRYRKKYDIVAEEDEDDCFVDRTDDIWQ